MYSGENNYFWRDEAELRRKFRRRLRIKRALVILAFFLVLALIGLLLFFVGKGAVTFFKEAGGKSGSDYIEEPAGVKLELVDNTFSDDKIKELFGNGSASASLGANETGKGGEDGNISDDDPESGNTSDTGNVTPTPDTEKPLRSGLIVVDAGHGGMDSGTFNGEILEKNINLNIALKLRDELQSRGYTVFMTRDDDTYVGLQKRATLANEQDNVLAMVSVHQNAVDSQKDQCYGVEAWTYNRSGCGEFAGYLVESICEKTGAKNRGFDYKKNLVVTSKTTMPSVLVECGFLSNDDECAKLASDEYQKLIALGIADAIDTFIDSYYK